MPSASPTPQSPSAPYTPNLRHRIARQFGQLRPNTLSGRLVLLSTTALLLAVLLIFLLMTYQQERLLRNQWAGSLSAQAELIADNSEAAVAFLDSKEADRLLAALIHNPLVLEARIRLLENGGVFARYVQPGARETLPSTADLRPRQLTGYQFFGSHVLVWAPIEEDGRPVALLELSASLTHIEAAIKQSVIESLWPLLAVFIALVVLSTRMMGRLLAPVRELRNLLRRLTENPSLSERAQQKGGHEIASLARGLNRLIDAVQTRDAELARYRDNLEQLVEERLYALEQATAEARRANQAKSNFLARMSHEIRTPMNAIVGLGRLLRRSPLSRQQRDQLDKIISSSDALLGVIDDVLDYSRIEAGKLSLERIPFDVLSLCQRALGVVTLRAEEKGLELLLQLDDGVPARVVGDPLRLGQVLINLLGNAVKFTQDGEVVLRVRCMSPAEGGGDATVGLCFSIVDSGVGIPADRLDGLFEPFSQGDDSITRRFGGTGLGLSICAQLVRLMDGEIKVETEPQQGSTFHVQLALPLATPERAEDAALPAVKSGRVLVIDDSAGARASLLTMLARLGVQAEACADGYAGLERLALAAQADAPFDKVLLDWRMAGLDGLQTARRIQAELNAFGAPDVILLVSNTGYEAIAPRIQEAGVAAVLVKPVLPGALHEALLEADASRPWAVGGEGLAALAEGETCGVDCSAIQGAHVLLVDDLPLNREVAREFLQAAGLRVSEACNGQEALAQLNELDDVVLVLMDIQMPVMDGLEATRHIRRDPRFRRLPVLAMTAHAMEGDRQQSLAAGMDDHLTKPIDPHALFTALCKWIAAGDFVVKTPVHLPPPVEVPVADIPLLPGLDIERGLSNHMGRPALYRRIMLGFRQQFTGAGAELRRLLADGALDDARRLMHSCKSAAATIGALSVSASAREIEHSLQVGQYLPELSIADFVFELNQVLDTLAVLEPPAAQAARAPADEAACAAQAEQGLGAEPASVPLAQLVPVLDHIQDLLARHDAEVERAVEALIQMLPHPHYQPELLAMREWIEEVEYEKVPQLLVQLRAKLEQVAGEAS